MTQSGDENSGPSLEALIESEGFGLEILHPGGLKITYELAVMCGIGPGTSVLDVASGTDASACYLTETFRARVVGIDLSDQLLERAKRKAAAKNVAVAFRKGDAHRLEFPDASFDVVISECTTCLLRKEQAIGEMVRVTKPGGRVGIHDMCWQGEPPAAIKERLAANEGERPETLAGWKQLFEAAGLIDVRTVDKSELLPAWTKRIQRQLGIMGQLRVFATIVRRWGLRGLREALESERIFRSAYAGYAIVVGRKAQPADRMNDAASPLHVTSAIEPFAARRLPVCLLASRIGAARTPSKLSQPADRPRPGR